MRSFRPKRQSVAVEVLQSGGCGSANLVGRAGALAAPDGDGALDERHFVVLDEEQAQAIGQSDL